MIPGESIFEPRDPETRRRQALSLLNDYSHPWDVLAEALQNSVDAINRRYRQQLANGLNITLDELEKVIETTADAVITADKVFHDNDFTRWISAEYLEGQRDRWFVALSEVLSKTRDVVKSAYENAEDQYRGRIKVVRDDGARKLVIRDNGVGMSYDELKGAVKKGVTYKRGYSEIGELGNGLTYLVSACNRFVLETCNGVERSSVGIENMYSWITGTAGLNEPLSSPVKLEPQQEPYTQVSMESIRTVESDYPDIFDSTVTTERFVHLIRTKTAAGSLYDCLRFPVFNTLRAKGMDVEIEDHFRGTTRSAKAEFSYRVPGQVLRELSYVPPPQQPAPPLLSLHEARDRLRQHRDIGGNSVEHISIYTSPAGNILYYIGFVTDREFYRRTSKEALVCDKPESDDLREIGRNDIIPGIELGVKGMPTGVIVDAPSTGFQGYWPNFHIMILDNRLRFDEGRKTPVGRRVALYRDCAENALFYEIGTEIISRAIKDAVVALNLAQMAKEASSLVEKRLKVRSPLDYDKVKLQNIPKYEQDVIALFHEMIGAGVLPYYQSLDCSSHSKYDAIFRYRIMKNKLGLHVRQQPGIGNTGIYEENIIVEFKQSADSVIEDIATNVKFYYMINLLVCWDINVAECKRLAGNVIAKPMNKVLYWGTTHELQLSPAHFMNVGSGRAMDVICLKELIKKLEDGTYGVA